MTRILPWLVAAAVWVVRRTCRIRPHDDPRPGLRAAGTRYVFAIFHAHHLTAVLAAEPGTVVMVSRSRDGEFALPTLRVCGCIPIRGSGGGGRKGGGPAIARMIKEVAAGRPAALTVDGPLGPRGHVYPGIALLARKTEAVVIPLLVIPTRRKVLTGAWDRLQVPLPFARIDLHAGSLLAPQAGESVEALALRIEAQLRELEHRFDPREARSPTRTKPSRKARSASDEVATDGTGSHHRPRPRRSAA